MPTDGQTDVLKLTGPFLRVLVAMVPREGLFSRDSLVAKLSSKGCAVGVHISSGIA
jgi:hypothetical protein